MRDVNPRGRERFDLSLDGRQIASVVVGTIVVLAVVFVLGLNVGKQLARSEDGPSPAASDPLAALDQAPAAPVAAVGAETLTAHDRLVKERPAAGEPAPAPAAAPPPDPGPAVAQDPEPSPAPAAEPPPPAPGPAAEPDPDPDPDPDPAPAGDWCVQVGAANDRAESERIAAKFERFHPRIEMAILQGKTWYRVRIGAFEDKADAEKYLKDLARETGAKGFVTSTR
jgi:cell division protein FtsN